MPTPETRRYTADKDALLRHVRHCMLSADEEDGSAEAAELMGAVGRLLRTS